MSETEEKIRQNIAELVTKYRCETNRSQSEADIRAGYIDQLFFALGWNIHNDPGQLTNYWREGYVRGAGIVDVGLEIAGEPALILEAKRFGVIPKSIERTGDRSAEEKQLFRYARGKRIPHCILTNFERLHVFNADHERLILAFDDPSEYLERLSELLHLSPEKVKAGSLPAWERQLEIKPIDEEFLAALQDWRLRLANAIYEHNAANPALLTDGSFDFSKLMTAVQRILDRLILIRYADDKEVLLQFDILYSIVSHYRNLGAYASRDHLMNEFINLSHVMDEHHNTTLFQPGHICEQVFVPNEVLEKVITEMNNISFRKFTSDILGNTYETYLGTKLSLKNGSIKSEARRDIRKAGGIYYTPTFIVRYIVDNTLGRLLQELEAEHGLRVIEKAREIKILDPACGSGSFLIYAYQVLADFYRRINETIENERVKLLAPISSPDMFQRLEIFKQLPEPLLEYPHHILEKQLYGVDIDAEAAEIAAVNLTMQAFADARREKLPLILNENVKVGNSLISGTEEELRRYFGDSWKDKKRFNWEEEFDRIMAEGGFDVVVGNPPWVSLKGRFGAHICPKTEIDYLIHKFQGNTYMPNMYEYFVARGLDLVAMEGFLSFIVPDRLGFNIQFTNLRKRILGETQIVSLVYKALFPGITADTLLFVFRKKPKEYPRGHMRICEYGHEPIEIPQQEFWDNLNFAFQYFPSADLMSIMKKIETLPCLIRLKAICESTSGFGGKSNLVTETQTQATQIETLKGDSIGRYTIRKKYWFEFRKQNITGRTTDERKLGAIPKILLRKTGDRIIATIDTSGIFPEQSLYFLFDNRSDVDFKYLLALLNSTLMTSYYRIKLITNRQSIAQLKKVDLDEMPIRRIDFANPVEKKMHDDLVALVERMLELNKRLAPIRSTPCNEREDLEREIKRTDEQIDNLVYNLYGLTEEERKIVEGESQSA